MKVPFPLRFRISKVCKFKKCAQIRIKAICRIKIAIFCFLENLKCQIFFKILFTIMVMIVIIAIVKSIFKNRSKLIIEASPPASPDIAKSSGKNGVLREAIFSVLIYITIVASENKMPIEIRQFRKIPTNKKLTKIVIIWLYSAIFGFFERNSPAFSQPPNWRFKIYFARKVPNK